MMKMALSVHSITGAPEQQNRITVILPSGMTGLVAIKQVAYKFSFPYFFWSKSL